MKTRLLFILFLIFTNTHLSADDRYKTSKMFPLVPAGMDDGQPENRLDPLTADAADQVDDCTDQCLRLKSICANFWMIPIPKGPSAEMVARQAIKATASCFCAMFKVSKDFGDRAFNPERA